MLDKCKDQNGRLSTVMSEVLQTSDKRLQEIMNRCTRKHLSSINPGTVIIMLGLSRQYISKCREIFDNVVGNVTFKSKPQVAYSNDKLLWIHMTHLSKRRNDSQFSECLNGEKFLKGNEELRRWARHFLIQSIQTEVGFMAKVNN